MGLFDWLFGKKAAARDRGVSYATPPRSNPRRRKKAMRSNPWKPCDDESVKLRRPSEFEGYELGIGRGKRKGNFKIVGCGVGSSKTRTYGNVRTGQYAGQYATAAAGADGEYTYDGAIKYFPKNWVASTVSLVKRQEAAKAAGVPLKRRKKAKKASASKKGSRVRSLVGRGCKQVKFVAASGIPVKFVACPPGVRRLQSGADQFLSSLRPAKKGAKKGTKKGVSGMVRVVDMFRAKAATGRPKKPAKKPAKKRAKKATMKPIGKRLARFKVKSRGFDSQSRKSKLKFGGLVRRRSPVEVFRPSMPGAFGRPSTRKAPVFSPDDIDFGMGRVAKPSMPGILLSRPPKKRTKKVAGGELMLPLKNPSRRRRYTSPY